MSKFTQRLSIFLIVTLVLGLVLPVKASAATGKVTDLTIHKITGSEETTATYDQLVNGTAPAGSKPISNISFTYWKVTSEQLKQLKANPQNYDTLEKVRTLLSEPTGTTPKTAADGTTKVPNLAEGYYWFIEDKSTAIKDAKAVPFGLELPITNEAGTGYINDLHVFPKNTLQDLPTIDKDVKSDDTKSASFAVGESFNWIIQPSVPEDFVSRVNFDLANDLGNLLNRTVAMINKYDGGKIPTLNGNVTEFDGDLGQTAEDVITEYTELMDKMQFSDGLNAIWKLVARTNKYIDETQPWVLAKDETRKAELDSVMVHLAASLRVIAVLIQPVMTHAPKEIFNQLGLDEADMAIEGLNYSDFPANKVVIEKGTPIFPRLDVEEEVAYIKDQMTVSDKKKGRKAMAVNHTDEDSTDWNPEDVELNLTLPQTTFDQFEPNELKVAEIIQVEKVQNADKLLKFRLDAGDPDHRQILSGVAEFYPEPEDLLGKKVVIVANLKPRKMKGEISQGMILSAEYDGKLKLITVDEDIKNGAIVG